MANLLTAHRPGHFTRLGCPKVVFNLVLLTFLAALRGATSYRGAYASICTNIKDEGTYLLEFILYHRWIGFGKIYVMDYNSRRPLSHLQMLMPFIKTGLVEYHYDADPRHHSILANRPFQDYSQGTAFQRCIDFAHRDHMWMAFIDTDEFLVLRKYAGDRPNVTAFLQRYEKYPGLAVNMRFFGSSGHVTRPEVGTLEAYTRCMPSSAWYNRHIKTIARLSQVLAIGGNPHEFRYLHNAVAVNEHGVPIKGPFSEPVSWDGIALHHYVTRSLAEFVFKMQRGPGGSQNKRSLDWFRAYEGNATESCTEGVQLWRSCCADQYASMRAALRRRSGSRTRGDIRGTVSGA
ncbi:hypothetical protein Agub_g12821 [Astrephomene gubernaculifera]|uniref:Glycosyltransferase family 92 protein n=1 Tax=Astrephomene gubernaculifera TaxID=47775 RepID=A0AAD3E139_9CHLO|nr:hypothetical protein Agub_g12821 [Astrephomene gubernaculifera]